MVCFMEISPTQIDESPDRKTHVRLSALVRYEQGAPAQETYWIEVPKALAENLTLSGNPWLVALLPVAVTIGEPIHIAGKVDPQLLENVRELMLVWKNWFPELKPVEVHASSIVTARSEPKHTAAFFSGGIDSFYTVLRHQPGAARQNVRTIDDLLLVWGFDVPLSNFGAYERMRDRLARAAQELQCGFQDLATNLRDLRFGTVPWRALSHGCALASTALALESQYSTVLVASTFGYANLEPWGSHPLTDPLLSTTTTRIVHDGAGATRAEKTQFVADSDIALKNLRVCTRTHSELNCNECSKCYRTMSALVVLGRLEACPLFDAKAFSVERLARVYSESEYSRKFLTDVQELALRFGRDDIATAIEKSFSFSDRRAKYLRLAQPLWKIRKIGRVAKLFDKYVVGNGHVR